MQQDASLSAQDMTAGGNKPRTVLALVNLAHFLDHYAMLIFPAALIAMAPAFDMSYGVFLAYATPGFVAFGAGALLMGWLGDRWSRRHMMVIFFLGIGMALVATGFARTPLEIGLGLFAIGIFASIYHPVGTAMIVAYAPRLGREIGVNGVWGNLGVASSALLTGLACEFLGWRTAFILPGVIAVGVGLAFAAGVRHENRAAHRPATAAARVPREAMWRVLLALILTIIAGSIAFNAVTVALPKFFAERLVEVTTNTAVLGALAAGVYLFGALTQYTIGGLIDRRGLRAVFLPLCFVLAPALYLAAQLSGLLLLPAAIGIIVALFGQVTVNDSMIGKYTTDYWRSRAYAVRYFLGYTAAGASVGLVALLHEAGGFALTFEALALLAVAIVVAGLVFPAERPLQGEEALASS